jgi:acyl-[acyl-carrier-protein] desaturase
MTSQNVPGEEADPAGDAERTELGIMRELVGQSALRGARRQWSIDELDWAALRPEQLTATDRSVVRFITFIEDHIPGYLTYFLNTFPVVGTDLGVAEFCFNREYFRFLIAWAHDEERHASALTRYQIEAGMSEPDKLALELAEEGRKQFALPYDHPIQCFAYTLVQEKATQLFYQRFRNVAAEPVLHDMLGRLARDESRHFAFYCQLVAAYVQRHGLAATVPDLKEVLGTFRMPLADSLAGYWRWSVKVADAAGYDHTEAYESLARVVRDFTGERGDASAENLLSFVQRIRGLLGWRGAHQQTNGNGRQVRPHSRRRRLPSATDCDQRRDLPRP